MADKVCDQQIFDLIQAEAERQRDGLELIPSENYVSREVLTAMGSVFTNKYSEGYPGHRYYGGQEYTDQVEEQIEELTRQHQPKILLVGYSAYSHIPDFDRLAEIGNRYGCLLMADMAHVAGLIAGGVHPNPLEHGFHVMTTTTHKTLRGPRGGMILSMGRVSNPLKKPEKTIENIPTLIDRSVFPGTQGGPLMHVIAAKAVALFEAMQPEFKDYVAQVVKNAARLADELAQRDYTLVGGGTENHLILINMMASRGINGKVAEETLDQIGLTANKNAIPADPELPFRPSGLRLGTPAVTTRGLVEDDMGRLATWIDAAIANRDNEAKLIELHAEVTDFVRQYPLPSDQ